MCSRDTEGMVILGRDYITERAEREIRTEERAWEEGGRLRAHGGEGTRGPLILRGWVGRHGYKEAAPPPATALAWATRKEGDAASILGLRVCHSQPCDLSEIM